MKGASVSLLLLGCLTLGAPNRVYIHPFSLFGSGDISCEAVRPGLASPPETVPSLPAVQEGAKPDPRPDPGELRNATQRVAVLAELQNSLGLRMFQALGRRRDRPGGVLLSPLSAFGTLVTLYLGTSGKTAQSYQQLLGLNWETGRPGCVHLVDGRAVLRTLRAIRALAGGPRDGLRTLAWAFVSGGGGGLSKDFVRAMGDLSDAAFTRAVNFSRPEEAEEQVNAFVRRTSDSEVENVFTGVGASTDLLFANSVHFKGSWRRAFHPEETTVQDFRVDETSTVKVPLMRRTGDYMHLSDPGRGCGVVRLPLSNRTYMLLVLPHEGVRLQDVESQLTTEVLTTWNRHLRERYLNLSLPKFSMTAATDLRSLLSDMAVEKYLLGSEASFERLSTKKNLTVDQVMNEVRFEMSEEGEEVQDPARGDGEPLGVTVNRPFLFAIVEGNSNAILVLGRIVNPSV